MKLVINEFSSLIQYLTSIVQLLGGDKNLSENILAMIPKSWDKTL